MITCLMLRRWYVECVDFEGEKRKVLVPFQGCMTCESYADCEREVVRAYVLGGL
jgi:hypothetical protein